MGRIKGIWNKIWIAGAAALLLVGCGGTWGRSAEETEAGQVEYFAYTDEDNRLWFWEQGAGEAMLLTDQAFALEGDEPYWQEWDDTVSGWVWNHEKAMEGSVQKAPDGNIFFPQEIRWDSFCMQRSVGEYEEALKYMEEDDVEEYAAVRMLLYDLYRQDAGAARTETEASDGTKKTEGQGQAGEPELVAESVCCHYTDSQGNIWYCKIEENGIRKLEGEEYPFAASVLYRYDGTENLRIGEINGRREEPFRVSAKGDYAVFFALDDGFYGCEPGEEAELLAEGLHEDLFDDWGVALDADINRIIYIKDDTVWIRDRKKGKEWQLTGEGEVLFAGTVGKQTDRILTLWLEETAYADWIERGTERADEDAESLLELMERVEYGLYPSLCHARVTDLSSGQAEDIRTQKGYLLNYSDVEELRVSPEVFYLEMIPEDSVEKFTLEELLGEETPGDVLAYYEELKADEVYERLYGEEYEEHILSEALSYYMDRGALEKRAAVYTVTADGISRAEGMDAENGIVGADYSVDGSRLYVTVYPWLYRKEDENENIFYRWLEDRYVLDGEGNCEKVVEAAEDTAVRNDEVFYTRETGMEGAVSLYRSTSPGRIAQAESVSLESIRKSPCSDRILFLTGDRAGYGEEGTERTLMLAGENGAEILEENVFRYGFYGDDSVWMLQYEEEEETPDNMEEDWESWDSESDDRKGGSCLYIYEDGEKRLITEQAVWMAGPGNRKTGVLWVYDY